MTVVLTTHYLEEAEQLCDRIAIINHGRVIANEPTRELVGKAQEKVVAVTVDRDVAALPDDRCFEKIALKGDADAGDHLPQGPGERGRGARRGAGATASGSSTSRPREADLEDVFLSLTRASNAA